MPTVTATNHLAANLSALGQRNAEVAALLQRVSTDDGVQFEASPQGVLTAIHQGKRLASAHRPLDEAARLVDGLDLVEHAVFVIYGFGLGYHVKRLAERLHRGGLILVFEPDANLLRAVFENVDHNDWLRNSPVIFVTNADDRAALATKLAGAEAIIAQGVEFIVHPPSKERLGRRSDQFAATLEEFVRTAKVTLMTTLVRSVETIRNLLLNIDHYGAGEGIEPLHNVARGCPAVIVSAGPSLARNIGQLARPGMRERCVIIAVQTTLKPLLKAGIRPHFVTALDYHEISRRFYEDLNAEELREVTLVAEPKVNRVVLDVYPGPVRCCASPFLDQVLGDLRRPMGDLKAGATVAHLALYLARYLGCDPVALVGQDLGFTDGLYYAPLPGAAIHDVWAPELNPFNTIEMMEWQRIVRHRTHLKKFADAQGRSIYSDLQMITYRQQFERDFAEESARGLTVFDATEGGVPKQHAQSVRLDDFLSRYATQLLPAWPMPSPELDRDRLRTLRGQVERTRKDIAVLQQSARQAHAALVQMLEHLDDEPRFNRLFAQVNRYRLDVEARKHAFELLDQMNQLGAFKRQRADRKIRMRGALPKRELQQAQIERDIDNVTWIADAATELIDQLAAAEAVLDGKRENADNAAVRPVVAGPARIAALVPIDLERSALGIPRSLAEDFAGRTVLQATLERLGQVASLESIILIASHGADIEPLIDRSRVGKPVEIEHGDGSPFGPEREAIAAARLFAPTCWRGGIAGMSIYDEALCPRRMHEVMQRRGLTAAIVAAPDWPLIDFSAEAGCEALIQRHLQQPEKLSVVFTQAPPGLCGCLMSASLMKELAQRNRLSTVGGLLIYQPHAPQPDPIARDANVQIDHRVRNALCRATFDSQRNRRALAAAMQIKSDPSSLELVQRIESLRGCEVDAPRHVVLELCTERTSSGLVAPQRYLAINRRPIDRSLAVHIIRQIADIDDAVLTIGGAGDPLLHPDFDAIIQTAKQAGIPAVHVQTELRCDFATIDRLVARGADIVSVDLHADRAATYGIMMGDDRFDAVLRNIEYLVEGRRKLTSHEGTAGFAIPWVVPRIQRRRETLDDIDTFFDRWSHVLGTAVIEGPRKFDPASTGDEGHLIPVAPPQHVRERESLETITILCDGSVPIDGDDLAGAECAARIAVQDNSLVSAWQALQQARRNLHAS